MTTFAGITHEEAYGDTRVSASHKEGSIDRSYLVYGTDDEVTAMEYIRDTIGSDETMGVWNLPLQNIDIEPMHQGGATDDYIWKASVRWGFDKQNSGARSNTSSYGFNTGGGTAHFQTARYHLGDWSNNAAASNFGGLINVADGQVAGVDVMTPNFTFEETHIHAPATAAIKNCTACVNNTAFRGYAAGEVLFVGAQGSKRGNGTDWEVTYRFMVSPNQTNYTVGNINIGTKQGWDYLWCSYKETWDASTKMIKEEIESAHLEQVYLYNDFTLLSL